LHKLNELKPQQITAVMHTWPNYTCLQPFTDKVGVFLQGLLKRLGELQGLIAFCPTILHNLPLVRVVQGH